jgi:hypothetical protein
MRKVFISYARQSKPDIEQLVEHLRVLGCGGGPDNVTVVVSDVVLADEPENPC